MENIYELSGKFKELNAKQEELQDYLDYLYEQQGGECTEETEDIESAKRELADLKAEVVSEILANSDAYAEVALNKAAQRKAAEAQLKEIKEACKARIAKAEAYANKYARSEEFWKAGILEAMQTTGTEKIGGPKTDLKYSVSLRKTRSIETDIEVLGSKVREQLECLNIPDYITVELKADKKLLGLLADGELPEGAAANYKQSVTIR